MNKTQPARGMRDFLPADVRKRNYVIGIIKEVYEKYGFEPLETPAVENLETLTGKYGEEGNQLMFRILKRGEKLKQQLSEFSELGELKGSENSPNSPNSLADLALRYDLTVPLARVVANYKNELPRFFKRYQIQPVWRADRPARGRFREFYQCDVDAIGSSSMIVEAELISAVCEILQRLGFDDFTIRINHRKFLTELLNTAGISEEKQIDFLIALDKLDKITINEFIEELSNRGVVFREGYDLIRSIEKFKSYKDILVKNISEEVASDFNNHLSSLIKNMINNHKSIEELEELLSFTNRTQSRNYVKLDPLLARGLSYYTGAIFEINVPDLAGSLGGGGRYDGLIGMFGKEQIPACGFSLGLERIIVVMEERGMFPPELENSSADVMIACFDENLIGDLLKLANDLRQEDLRVLVYPEASQKGKPMKYAEQIKVPFVCLLKENELAEHKVTLKNMQTDEQQTVLRHELVQTIKQK